MGFFSRVWNVICTPFRAADTWLKDHLPSWAGGNRLVRWGLVGGGAVAAFFAAPWAWLGLGLLGAGALKVLEWTFYICFTLYVITNFLEFLRDCFGGSGNEPCDTQDASGYISPRPEYRVYREERRQYRVFNPAPRDNGRPWFHQPNIRNSYGF